MFTHELMQAIEAVAADLGVDKAALMAVVEVESGGIVYASVEGRTEPPIRFEGHYFDRRLTDGKRAEGRRLKLASPVAGRIANPRTQVARWRLLERAAALDRKAAYESVSWGCGQVMGAHWAWLGYDTVDALVAEARDGAGGQVRLMARFIRQSGLGGALKAKDWHAFARGYNGPAYEKQRYHVKLAAAFARHSGGGRRRATATMSPPAALMAVATSPWRAMMRALLTGLYRLLDWLPRA